MGNKVSHSVLARISQRAESSPLGLGSSRGSGGLPVGTTQLPGRNNRPLLSQLRTMEKGEHISKNTIPTES